MVERGAKDTKVTMSFFEELPIIAHFRAITHYLFGETKAAANALKSATHNTVAGCLGIFAGILVRPTNITVAEILASIGGSIIGGIFIDSYISVLTSTPYGYYLIPEEKEKRFTAAHLMFKDGMIGSSTFLCHTVMPNWMTNEAEMKNAVIVKEVVLCIKELYEVSRTQRIKNIEDLQKGDHIKFLRYYLYSHHAIVTNVTDNGDKSLVTVIHFTGNGKSNAMIKEKVLTFEDCRHAYKLMYHGNHFIRNYPRFPPDVTVAIANYYEKSDTFGRYSFFYNNCEHFAMTCCTGIPLCFQKTKIPFIILLDYKVLIRYEKDNDHFSVCDQNGDAEFNISINST